MICRGCFAAPVTFIPSQRTTHSDVITVTNTFIINYDFAHVDPTSANVAKIGGGGGGTGRRSSGRVKPLTSRKKHLLLLREQQAFMARLDQIRNHRIEVSICPGPKSHAQHDACMQW